MRVKFIGLTELQAYLGRKTDVNDVLEVVKLINISLSSVRVERLNGEGRVYLVRYSNRIMFVREFGGGYNPNTGEHYPVTVERTERPCNINALGIDREMKVFGEVDVGVIIARLQRPHHAPFDYAVVTEGIYKGKYRIKKQATHRSKSAFYLEGIK